MLVIRAGDVMPGAADHAAVGLRAKSMPIAPIFVRRRTDDPRLATPAPADRVSARIEPARIADI